MRTRWQWQWHPDWGDVAACWWIVWMIITVLIGVSPHTPEWLALTSSAIWLAPYLLTAIGYALVTLARNPPVRRIQEPLPDLRETLKRQ